MFTDYAQNLHGHWRGQCLSPQLLKLGLHSVYTAFLQYLVLVVEDWRLSTMITTLRTIYTLSGKKKKKKILLGKVSVNVAFLGSIPSTSK